MPGGTPVGRPWVVVLCNGTVVIDWGDGIYIDAISGDFLQVTEREISHQAHDSDLDWLRRIGRVECYDARQVYFLYLPERIKRAIE